MEVEEAGMEGRPYGEVEATGMEGGGLWRRPYGGRRGRYGGGDRMRRSFAASTQTSNTYLCRVLANRAEGPSDKGKRNKKASGTWSGGLLLHTAVTSN